MEHRPRPSGTRSRRWGATTLSAAAPGVLRRYGWWATRCHQMGKWLEFMMPFENDICEIRYTVYYRILYTIFFGFVFVFSRLQELKLEKTWSVHGSSNHQIHSFGPKMTCPTWCGAPPSKARKSPWNSSPLGLRTPRTCGGASPLMKSWWCNICCRRCQTKFPRQLRWWHVVTFKLMVNFSRPPKTQPKRAGFLNVWV